LDEVDDTSILKTGGPSAYRRSLSRLRRPEISLSLSELSRSDLVRRRNLAVHQGVDEGRVAALLRTSIIAACTKRGWWYEIPSYPCEP